MRQPDNAAHRRSTQLNSPISLNHIMRRGAVSAPVVWFHRPLEIGSIHNGTGNPSPTNFWPPGSPIMRSPVVFPQNKTMNILKRVYAVPHQNDGTKGSMHNEPAPFGCGTPGELKQISLVPQLFRVGDRCIAVYLIPSLKTWGTAAMAT